MCKYFSNMIKTFNTTMMLSETPIQQEHKISTQDHDRIDMACLLY